MDILSRHAMSGEAVDMSESFMYLGFDLVSELTFGESFNMLKTGQPNEIIGEFIKGKKLVGFSLLTMWLFSLLKALPGVDQRIYYWLTWYEKALDKREQVCDTSAETYISNLV